jgi:predicted acylesterase/phospholipase RssA
MRGIYRWLVPGILIAATCLIAASYGGCLLRTPYLLKAANKPAAADATPPSPRITADRIERMVRTHLVDSYVDPTTVGTWLDALSANPKPIIDLLQGLVKTSAADPAALYETFNRDVSPTLAFEDGRLVEEQPSVWKLPPTPLVIEDKVVGLGILAKPLQEENKAAAGLELDAERFAANARAIASSLLVLQNLIGTGPLPDSDLRSGISRGAERAKNYLLARKWRRRVGQPTTALVMSGGAANGAFTAGFVWRLSEVLQACRAGSGLLGCPDAGLDLAVGSSTGSLIGVTADIFSTPGQETRGRDFLLRSYTCSVEADLYCVNDVWDWKLFQDTRGLVQFDGVRRKLDEMLSDSQRDNSMELVTMTVDYQTGDLLAESDQDPADGREKKDRIDAILASIVEPVMADPVERLGRPGSELPGTFIDGGVRSGTPAMEASRRGAERVLVIKSASLDSDLRPRQKNALSMLARTIDLLVDQVGATEIQQATLFSLGRRLGEYNLCEHRLVLVGDSTVDNPDPALVKKQREAREARAEFCKRQSLVPGVSPGVGHAESAVATFLGPEVFGQVAQSWRSVWVVRPEGEQSASGYAFDPQLMRRLFVFGINTFQTRCKEVLGLMGISKEIQTAQCSPDAGAAAVARAQADIQKCVPSSAKIKPCKN